MKCNSNNYRDSYKYSDVAPEHDERRHRPQPKPQTETILRCGTSVGSTPLSCNGPALDGGGTAWQTIVLATVALDTSQLIDPTVKIDFSSLVSFKTLDNDNYFLRLVFKLSKICCGSPIPLGTWAFEKIQHEDEEIELIGDFVQETGSFCFSWCGCEDCPDCCRYIVEIIDEQCFNIDFAAVTNVSLSALAVGLKKV